MCIKNLIDASNFSSDVTINKYKKMMWGIEHGTEVPKPALQVKRRKSFTNLNF
jgi:hypothetical protein